MDFLLQIEKAATKSGSLENNQIWLFQLNGSAVRMPDSIVVSYLDSNPA